MSAGGWQGWEWNETLFAGAAPYYSQGRLPYAEADGTHRPGTEPEVAHPEPGHPGPLPGVVGLLAEVR
jgi:hypothetical protein